MNKQKLIDMLKENLVIWDFKYKENSIQRLICTYILDDKKQLEE